ncbi:hypothetical protein Emag_003658 [Eimeria magna]
MEIYIPPSRTHRASSIGLGLAPELPDDLGVLEDAVKEIENAISHLTRDSRQQQQQQQHPCIALPCTSSSSRNSRGSLEFCTSSSNRGSSLQSAAAAAAATAATRTAAAEAQANASAGCLLRWADVQEGEDPDLRDAIEENLEALKKKEERLNQIRKKMATLGAREDACVHNAAAAAAPAGAAAAAAAAADKPTPSSSTSPSDEGGPAVQAAGSAAAPATAAPATSTAAETASASREAAASEADGLAHLTQRLRQLSTSTADRGAPGSPDELADGVYL